jgi:surfactin synthase thioesterase subunit
LSLVCLPFAGSGAGFFRAWRDRFRDELTIVPLQLPGREERFLDEPYQAITDAGAELTPLVAELLGDSPVALFGHSMGALLAYEIAQRLAESGGPQPVRLFVSGSGGPGAMREQRATGLDDAAFLARVQEFAGYRHEALSEPDLLELLLPLLRADVAMHEAYVPRAGLPLTIPVTALRGAEDTLVTLAQAEQWRTVTSAAFSYTELPGGHMYLADSPEPLMRVVTGG